MTFLDRVNSAIITRLKDLGSDIDFQSLEDSEAEQHILRYAQLYSYLYISASFVERADVPHTLVELVQPIKRLMQQELKQFELILHPLPVLNYSFFPLGRKLSEIVDRLGFAELLVDFPSQLVAIGFPGLETGRFLVHCIIAHELGHCLYLEQELESRLLPLIRPDEQKLDGLVKAFAEARVEPGFQQEQGIVQQRTLSEYISELEIKSSVTTEITEISKFWMKELTCDAIAYLLFGPAYLLAALNFLTSMRLFDDDRDRTHPPNRMRLLLLYRILDEETAFLKSLDHKVVDVLELWRTVATAQAPHFTDPIRDLAGAAILNIYHDIIRAASDAVVNIGSYSASDHADELTRLGQRVKRLAPPNELIENGIPCEVEFQSVINVGWLAYITELEPLVQKYGWDHWECKAKLNDLIAKAVELNQIQRRWKEVQ